MDGPRTKLGYDSSPVGGQPPGAGADTWVSLPVQPQSAGAGFRSFCMPYSRAIWGRGRMARRLARGPGRGGARRIPRWGRGGPYGWRNDWLAQFLGRKRSHMIEVTALLLLTLLLSVIVYIAIDITVFCYCLYCYWHYCFLLLSIWLLTLLLLFFVVSVWRYGSQLFRHRFFVTHHFVRFVVYLVVRRK